jgi:hypothetical protein
VFYNELSLIVVTFLLLVTIILWLYFNRICIDNLFIYPVYTLFFWCFGQAYALYFLGDGVRIDGAVFYKEQNILFGGSVIMLVLYFSFYMGIIYKFAHVKPFEVPRQRNFINIKFNRLPIVTLFIFILITFALYLMAKNTGVGFFQLITSSSKQYVLSEGGVASFNANGYSRTLARFGMPFFLVLAAIKLIIIKCQVACSKKQIFLLNACLFISIVPAFLPQYVLSSRGYFMFGFFSIMFMSMLNGFLTIKKLLLFLCFAICIFSLMSALRYDGDGSQASILDGITHLLFYGGGNSIFNQSLIYEYISDGGGLHWGDIYLGIMSLPIPRSFWEAKPLFSFDQIIARDIYGLIGPSAYAIPAGLIGESLLNFGKIGAVFSMFFFGYVCSTAFIKILRIRKPLLSLIIRGVIFPRFMFTLIGSGLGFALMETIILSFGIFLAYFYLVEESSIAISNNDDLEKGE